MSDNITFDTTKGIFFVDSGTKIIGNASNMTIDGDSSVNLLGDTSISISSPSLFTTGHITSSGNISSSGYISASHAIFPNLPSNVTSKVLYFNDTSGVVSFGAAANQFNAAGISGSWQGQEFVSASQTFLSTGQRNGDSAITGSLEVTNELTLGNGNIRSDNNFDFLTNGGAAQQINVGKLGMSASYSAANTAIGNMTTTNAAVFGGDVSVGPHNNGKLGVGTLTPGEKLTVHGNISASGTLSAGLAQVSGSHIVYYNTSSGLFTHENFNPPVDKVRFSGLNSGDTTVNDDGGSTAEFTLSGSTSLGINVRGDAATSTIGIELHTVGLPEITNFDHTGGTISNEDSFVVHDVSAGVAKRTLAGNIDISAFNNNASYSSTVGTMTSITVNTAAGLDGGTTLTGTGGTINLSLDLSDLTDMTAAVDGTQDQLILLDNGAERRKRVDEISLSQFNNDTAGAGLSSINGVLHFDPGGTSGELITSDGAGSYNTHSTLIYDGTDLQVHSGDIIAFFSSDKRLKDNVTPITNPISKIMKIGGYTFDWNEKQDTYNGHDVGVIAQEVEKVLPEVVETRENGYKAVKYDKMVPLLIEAIKDQQKQIDELKKLIENGK